VLIGVFAFTSFVLSVVGIHGVMAYFVQQLRRDIGIRLALGGDPARMRHMVLLKAVQLAVVGILVGVGAALVTSRLMTTLLFGVSSTELRTMIGVPMAILVVAILACLMPAHRGASIDPAEILRDI
jgi:ABC-type antimicrobial peptide transport system permease subunit